MLPLSVDYAILLAVILTAAALTLWARRGALRAAKWGRALSRFCYGPVVLVLFLDPIYRFNDAIESLDLDIHAAPNAPLSTATGSVQALQHALRFENWLPLILIIGVAIYAATDLPRIAADRQAGVGNAASTPREA